MRIKLFPTLCCSSLLLLAICPAGVDAMPVLMNSSLTGPVATGTVPPDWFLWQKTPDTVDATGPFNNTGVNWTLSPNGGTFVRAGGSDFPNSEAFAQNVTGLTIGATYQVTFHQTNLGFENPTSGAWNGEDGFWELVVDGLSSDTSTTLSKQAVATNPIVWTGGTMSFVAPNTTAELAFVSRAVGTSGLAAYMGIDGIRIQPIPEPTAIVLLCFSLAALAAKRR
ncbi:MAG: PEP-CTERM sorting domain-containing protein [Planctomycetota bacterium]